MAVLEVARVGSVRSLLGVEAGPAVGEMSLRVLAVAEDVDGPRLGIDLIGGHERLDSCVVA